MLLLKGIFSHKMVYWALKICIWEFSCMSASWSHFILHILIFIANHPNAVDKFLFFYILLRIIYTYLCIVPLDFSQIGAFYAVQSWWSNFSWGSSCLIECLYCHFLNVTVLHVSCQGGSYQTYFVKQNGLSACNSIYLWKFMVP